MAAVWYFPGWMRAQKPARGLLAAVERAFPGRAVAFKPWDGDGIVWPLAVDSADKEAWRFAFEIATMPPEERESLVLAGHSLGGRIVVRVLARLASRGLKVRQAVLLGAAMPLDDPDLAQMGAASELPVLAVCNPDDVTLRYVYALAGGEKSAAFGANGTLAPCANVVECVVPPGIAGEVEIDRPWARVKFLKDVANHHEKFYIEYAGRILSGEEPSGEIMTPQDWPTLETRVADRAIFWTVLDSAAGWKLERNRISGHCRILDPSKKRAAWGREKEMRAAFAKVRRQLSRPAT